MVNKDKIKQCASNIVRFINIQNEGECVLVKGGLYCQELLEEVALELYRKGAIPHITSTSDYYDDSLYQDDEIKSNILEMEPRHYLKLIKEMEAYVVIEPYEDPGILNKAPREKLDAKLKREKPLKDILYGRKEEFAPGKKWCYAGWPSKKAADYYHIQYELLEKFIVGGMSVPQEQMNKLTVDLGNFFVNAKKVYVTDKFGTDFWVSIENRPRILDDGLITNERISTGLLGGNLPAGEVFFPPHEKKGEGTLFCPLTRDRHSNKIIKNIFLTFKDGRLLIDKVTADKNLDDLLATFKHSEELDRKMNLPEIRTYNVGEFAVGCNPKITKAIGYILTDEKINGSVHVAFGGNKMMGGTSISNVHWDFVTAPESNVTLEYIDGTKRAIMEEGNLIDS